jgi:hypothetical protein
MSSIIMETKYTNEELAERRLAGILPHININGWDFIVDWRLRELRAADNPSDRIGLRNLPMDPEGVNYLCFYNTKLRHTIIPDINMTSLPKNVVFLEIPYELKLDPVAVAREMGLPDTDLLKSFPIEQYLKAKATPLEETEMVQLVSRNLEKQRILNRSKPTVKKRKGKGL